MRENKRIMKCLSVLCAFVVISSLLLFVDAKKKNKFEGDFEFVDEVSHE